MLGKNSRKILIAVGLVPLFAVVFMFLGMFIDIQVILKYDYSPISFTFTFLFVGVLIGILLTFKTAKQLNKV